MVASLRTTQIQEPSSSTVNIALSTAGGVTVGQNLTVAGTTALNGSSSGSTLLQASATASGTITLPAGTGTAAIQGVSSNIVSGTSIPTTSGTAIPVTNIPSWAKRITLMFNGVSTSGTLNIIVQLGTGGTPTYTTSGYNGTASNQTGAVATAFTSGFIVVLNVSASGAFYGQMILNNFGSNIWSESSIIGTASTVKYGAGTVSLGATLTALQLTTASPGTDTFNAGSINILYE